MSYRHPAREEAQVFNYMDVSKGKVSGESSLLRAGLNENINLTFQDISSTGGAPVLPTTAETLELVSTSANDNSSGTGSRSFLVTTLDANYDRVSQVVIPNGVTPVALTGTHIRTETIVNLSSGSSRCNEGVITLQQAGSGTVYETVAVDKGISQSSTYTVPAGFTARTMAFQLFTSKGDDGIVQSITSFEDGTQVTVGAISTYQAGVVLPVLAPIPLMEKTTVRLQAKSTNTGVTMTLFAEYLETKNEV